MSKRQRVHCTTRIVAPGFTETIVRGTPSPPGTPISTSFWPPYEQIKHLLKDVPFARASDPVERPSRTTKRRQAKDRRAKRR